MKVGKLDYNIARGEGSVKINWKDMPGDVMMLDLLRDWICDLEGIYEAKHKEVFERKQGETK